MKKFVGMIIVVIGILSLFNVYNDELKVILPITVDENIYNNLIKISNLLTSAGAVGFVLFIIRLASVADSTNRERDIELKNLLDQILKNENSLLEVANLNLGNSVYSEKPELKDLRKSIKFNLEKTETVLKGLKEFARLTDVEKLQDLTWQKDEILKLMKGVKNLDHLQECKTKLLLIENTYRKILSKVTKTDEYK